MVLKDWTRYEFAYGTKFIHKSKENIIFVYRKIANGKLKYNVRIHREEDEKSFGTEASALKFAKSYMRSH
jgi:hypothetical protein